MLPAIFLMAVPLGEGAIDVQVDPRVELVTTVFRLAGAGEFRMPAGESAYSARVDAHFGAFRDHLAVRNATRLREKYGIGFDAVASLAIYLSDARQLDERIPFSPPPKRWDSRWDPQEARAFLADLRRFSADTKFTTFFEKEMPYYVKATRGLKELLARYDLAGIMRRFYGVGPKRPPNVIVGMLCGAGNYGMSLEFPNGDLEVAPIFGASRFDAEGVPIFDESNLPTVVHEFSHPFVNPAVAKHLPRLKTAVARLMPRLRDVYRSQAYAGEETVAIETMVRAVDAYIAAKHLPADVARNNLVWHRCAGFLATSDLAEKLDAYERNRAKYKTFSDYLPVLCRVFEEVTKDPEKLYSRCPRIAGVDQRWGAESEGRRPVDLRVTFDQPMLSGRFGSWLEGGEYEQIGKSQYDESRQVLLMSFRVDATKEFVLCVNPQGWGSIGENGYPALPSRHKLVAPKAVARIPARRHPVEPEPAGP